MRFGILLACAAILTATATAKPASDSCRPIAFVNVCGATIKQDGIVVQSPNIPIDGQKTGDYAIDVYTTILKADTNLDMAFNYGLKPLAVQEASGAKPALYSGEEVLEPVPAVAQRTLESHASAIIPTNLSCLVCLNPPCTDKPDITFRIESLGCDSAAYVQYSLCNLGNQPFSGTLNVGVYQANPLNQGAFLLDFFELPVANLQPDSCRTGTLKNLYYWGTYNKVYTLAGIESWLVPPIDPAGFPYNGIAECDYANNLDSLTLQYPPAPQPELGPSTAICPGDTLLLGTGSAGFVAYKWQDGSSAPVYAVTDAGFFELTTRDGCGRTATDNISVSLKTQPKAVREIVLLPGDSVFINGQTYKASGMVIAHIPASTGGCDTVVTYNIFLDSLHCKRPGAFFKIFQGMNGRVLTPASGGAYYVGGGTNLGHVLAKFDGTGQNQWVRQFDFFGNSYIQTLIEDSEGKLVGSATAEGGKSLVLAFRYDPAADQLLWVKQLSATQATIRGFEIIEKKPGGDFLLVNRLQSSTSGFKTEIVTLARATGEALGNKSWQYSPNASLNAIAVHQGVLYASGVLRDTAAGNLFWQNGLMKIDLNTGIPLWSKITHVPGTNLYSGDLLVDSDGRLVSTWSASDNSLWLQKTNTDGALVWLKKLQFYAPHENSFIPKGFGLLNDGYLIGIQTYSDSTNLHSYIVAKTDKSGSLKWAKKVPKVGGTFTVSPNQLATRGNEGCFVTNTFGPVFQHTGMVFGKLDKNGALGESCPVATDVPVLVTDEPAGQGAAFVEFTQVARISETLANTPSRPQTVLQYTACSKCLLPCESIATMQTIEFYPGDTITLGNQHFVQSDTVTITWSTMDGCDSVVTYFLRRVDTNIDLVCPSDFTVTIPAGQSSVSVSYPLPAAATDCPQAGIVLKRLQGPPPGGACSQGTTKVCYEAANHCGIRDTCCFVITALPTDEEVPCDIKTPPGGCIRFELLSIRLDAQGNPRYRIRLTNSCASPLKFAWFQLPDGITAKAPAHGSVFTASGGNTYDVRNPGAGPFHAIRFKPLTGDLKNGESDIFEYTLPKQTRPDYIHAAIKLADGTSAEAHINTFFCPVLPYAATGVTPTPAVQSRQTTLASADVLIQPNPNHGYLQIQVPKGDENTAILSVWNAQGQLVLEGRYTMDEGKIGLHLPEGLANGLYYLRVQTAGREWGRRFVKQRR